MIRTKKNKDGSGGNVTLFSSDGSKELYKTTYNKSEETKEQALERARKREKEIEYFKNKEKGGW